MSAPVDLQDLMCPLRLVHSISDTEVVHTITLTRMLGMFGFKGWLRCHDPNPEGVAVVTCLEMAINSA